MKNFNGVGSELSEKNIKIYSTKLTQSLVVSTNILDSFDSLLHKEHVFMP